MAHFYLNPELVSASIGDEVELVGAEARHAVTVSRVHAGEELSLGNGAGLVVRGIVRVADAARLSLEVAEVAETPRRTPGLWLAQALAKGGRDELAVQAATELGVDGVIPWSAGRSVSRWEGAKIAKGQERWGAIVREATKQSVRSWLPEVSGLVSTKQLAALAAAARLVVLDPLAETPLTELVPDARDLVVVVGPEGGIAPNELDLLYSAGAAGARLGKSILRTSTAGPAAIAVLNAKLGRW